MATQSNQRPRIPVYDPQMPNLKYDPVQRDYVDSNGVRYYMYDGRCILKSHQQVNYQGRRYVVVDGELRNDGERGRISTNMVQQQAGIREAQSQMDRTYVLAGFPQRSTVAGFENDALLARQNYNQTRYRYIQEEAMALNTSDGTEGVYEGICKRRLSAEMRVYKEVVPSRALFEHFKNKTISDISARIENGTATEQDHHVLDVLQGKNPPTSFYEFSVAIDAVSPLERPAASMGESDETAAEATQIYQLSVERMNASFAMHYYMDQMGAEGLPQMNLSAYNAGRAYQNMEAEMAKQSTLTGGQDAAYDYFETVYPAMQESEGEAAGFDHLFRCMQSSPRWQDISHVQSQTDVGLSQAERTAWGYLTPTVSLPDYYGAPLDEKVAGFQSRQRNSGAFASRHANHSASHADAVRHYYRSNSILSQSLTAIQNYQRVMGSRSSAGGAIPYYAVSSTIAGAHHGVGANANAQSALGAAQTGEGSLNEDTSVLVSGSDVALAIGGFAAISFIPGMIIFGGASYGIHCAVEAVKEGRIQNGVDHLKKINQEVAREVVAHKTRLNELNRHPASRPALIYTRNQLQAKHIRTPDEERMLAYLNAEIENPATNTFGDIEFDDSIFNVSDSNLKAEVETMSQNYRELVQAQNELNVYAYAMSMYQNAHVTRQDAGEINDASDQARASNEQEYQNRHGVNPNHFRYEATVRINASVRGSRLTPTQHQGGVSSRVEATLRSYESIMGTDPFNPTIPGARTTYRSVRQDLFSLPDQMNHRYQAMRALTRRWTNPSIADYENVPSNIAVSYSSGDVEQALFGAYSFEALKKRRLAELNSQLEQGTPLSEAEQKEIEILEASTSFASYQKACNEQGIEGVLTASHRTKPTSLEGKTGWAVRGHHQLNTCIDSLHNMAEEQYEFLQSIQHYAQSGNLLKGYTTSRNIVSLFPSRQRRMDEALQHPASIQQRVTRQFVAEKEVLSDMFAVLQSAPDFQEICEQNNWLGADGKFDEAKLYSAPQPAENSEMAKARHEADVLEERVCRVLRAMESYRQEQKRAEQDRQSQQAPDEAARSDAPQPTAPQAPAPQPGAPQAEPQPTAPQAPAPQAGAPQAETPVAQAPASQPAPQEEAPVAQAQDEAARSDAPQPGAPQAAPQPAPQPAAPQAGVEDGTSSQEEAPVAPVLDEQSDEEISHLTPREQVVHLMGLRDAQNPLRQAQIIRKLNSHPELIYQLPNPRTREKSILALAVEGGHKEVVAYVFDKARDDGKKIPKRILTEALKTAIEKGDKEMLEHLVKEIGPRWREVEMDVYNMLIRQKDPTLVEVCAPLLKNENQHRTPADAQQKIEQLSARASVNGQGAAGALAETAEANITTSTGRGGISVDNSRGNA